MATVTPARSGAQVGSAEKSDSNVAAADAAQSVTERSGAEAEGETSALAHACASAVTVTAEACMSTPVLCASALAQAGASAVTATAEAPRSTPDLCATTVTAAPTQFTGRVFDNAALTALSDRLASGDEDAWHQLADAAYDGLVSKDVDTDVIASCFVRMLRSNNNMAFPEYVLGPVFTRVRCAKGWPSVCSEVLGRLDGNVHEAIGYASVLHSLWLDPTARANGVQAGGVDAICAALRRRVSSAEAVTDDVLFLRSNLAGLLASLLSGSSDAGCVEFVERGGLDVVAASYPEDVPDGGSDGETCKFAQRNHQAITEGVTTRCDLATARIANATLRSDLAAARAGQKAAERRAVILDATCSILSSATSSSSVAEVVRVFAGAVIALAAEYEGTNTGADAGASAEDELMDRLETAVTAHLRKSVTVASAKFLRDSGGLKCLADALRECVGGKDAAHLDGKLTCSVLATLAEVWSTCENVGKTTLQQWRDLTGAVVKGFELTCACTEPAHLGVVPRALHLVADALGGIGPGNGPAGEQVQHRMAGRIVETLRTVGARRDLDVSWRLATFAAAARVLKWKAPKRAAEGEQATAAEGEQTPVRYACVGGEDVARSCGELLAASLALPKNAAVDTWQQEICVLAEALVGPGVYSGSYRRGLNDAGGFRAICDVVEAHAPFLGFDAAGGVQAVFALATAHGTASANAVSLLRACYEAQKVLCDTSTNTIGTIRSRLTALIRDSESVAAGAANGAAP